MSKRKIKKAGADTGADQYLSIDLHEIPYSLDKIEDCFQHDSFLPKHLYGVWYQRVVNWIDRAEARVDGPALYPGDDFNKITLCFQTWLDHNSFPGAENILELHDLIHAYRGVFDDQDQVSLDQIRQSFRKASRTLLRVLRLIDKRREQRRWEKDQGQGAGQDAKTDRIDNWILITLYQYPGQLTLKKELMRLAKEDDLKIDSKTMGKHLAYLESDKIGLISRPKGERKGYGITNKGETQIKDSNNLLIN